MINSNTTSRISTLFMVALMVVSMVAMPAIAAVTYDNETANTSTTSDLLGGDVVTDLDNSSKTQTIEVQSDNASSGDDFTLNVTVNDTNSDQDGESIYSTSESWTATNKTAGHYKLNITHATVFETLERDAGENVTLDVTTTVNKSESSEESQTIQIHAQNEEDTAVSIIGEGEDSLDTSNNTGVFGISLSSLAFWSDDDDDSFEGAAQATETVGVNASNTSVVRVELTDPDAADAGSIVMEDTESGDFIGIASAQVDDEYVPTFAESASDVDWIDTSTDTFATVDSEGDTVTYHNVNETVDSDGDVELSTTLNDGLGLNNARKMLSDFDDLSITNYWSLAVGATDINGDAFDDGFF